MRTNIVHNLAYTHEQPRVVQHRLTHCDAVLTELASFSDQPRSMGQCPHWNRSVICRHTAELIAGNKRGSCTQIGGAKRRQHTRRSCADDDDV
jgi:hypothetical protein